MPQPDPIIVFHTFQSTVEANIVKAKLDAYGIPCFLTQEHLTTMVTSFLSGGVRLHIFERDCLRVAEILQQDFLQKSDDDDLLSCPNCRSKRVLDLERQGFDSSKVVKFLLQLSKRHYCVDCEAEFEH